MKLIFYPESGHNVCKALFKKMISSARRTVRQFATKLQRFARDCNYGEQTDNQIRGEILSKYTSSYIKRKLPDEGQGLSLAKTPQIAKNCEKVNSQMATICSTKQDSIEVVNYMKESKDNGRDKKPQVSHDKTSYRCGSGIIDTGILLTLSMQRKKIQYVHSSLKALNQKQLGYSWGMSIEQDR